MIVEERGGVADRRMAENVRWSDPRVIVATASGCLSAFLAACALAVILFGALIGTLIFMRTSAATSEISNAALSEKLTKMDVGMASQFAQINDKLDDKSDDIQKEANANIEQKGQIAEIVRVQSGLAEDIKVNVSATNGLRDRVSRLESK